MSDATNTWIDRCVLDRLGAPIGVIVDVYDGPHTAEPEWLALRYGFFGTRIGVVPIAAVSAYGADAVVSLTCEQIAAAPPFDVSLAVRATPHRELSNYYAGLDIGSCRTTEKETS